MFSECIFISKSDMIDVIYSLVRVEKLPQKTPYSLKHNLNKSNESNTICKF